MACQDASSRVTIRPVPRLNLVTSTPSAPWLPAGSTAEVWAGASVEVPDPCIIVRLLLSRTTTDGRRFFCVPTYRGLDLPTMPLTLDQEDVGVTEGLSRLSERMLGRDDVGLTCVGYVRNVVPAPNADYAYPTPWAHVPVFVPAVEVDPIVEGSWLSLMGVHHAEVRQCGVRVRRRVSTSCAWSVRSTSRSCPCR